MTEQTHYEGCERERGHHTCALVKLAAAEAALEDTKRLDWLESHHACVGHHKTTDRWWSRAGRSFKSPRAAIDAARSCPKCNTAPLP